MKIADVLLVDYDAEIANTRRTLERIPSDKPDWVPHTKSMKMGKLTMHVALMPYFCQRVLASREMQLANEKFPNLTFEDREKTLGALAESSAAAREILVSLSDEDLQSEWKMLFHDHVIFSGPKMLAYRTMFFNHLVHHRAQLGVYLRLLDEKVPGLYGPSADEQPPVA